MAAKDENRPSYPMLGKLPVRSAGSRTGAYRGEPSEGISDRAIQRRQLPVDEAVVGYLANRIERSYAAARQAVEMLDTEALRLGRPVTRALAAELLRNA